MNAGYTGGQKGYSYFTYGFVQIHVACTRTCSYSTVAAYASSTVNSTVVPIQEISLFFFTTHKRRINLLNNYVKYIP